MKDLKIKQCAEEIQIKFGLIEQPTVDIVDNESGVRSKVKKFEYKFRPGVPEFPDQYSSREFYKSYLPNQNTINPIEQFEEEYPQLYKDAYKKKGFVTNIAEVRITIKDVTISAGFNWTIIGTLRKSNQTFCAVIYVFTREMFRGRGIASLLKEHEIKMAARHNCNFIHTWHAQENPHFTGAIIPSLQNGFIFFHEEIDGEEEYEDKGYVHLRKYFENNQSSRVKIKNEWFTSPKDNAQIVSHLSTLNQRMKYVGKSISNVENPIVI